jgi:predicted Ser/Thr protein kinase
MSQLQREITYKIPLTRPGFWLAIVTFPAWGLAAPLGLITFICAAMVQVYKIVYQQQDANLDQMLASFALAFISAGTFLLGSVFCGIMQESKVLLDPEGLILPFLLTTKNKRQRFVAWQEIEAVSVESDNDKNDHLILKTGAGVVDFNLSIMTRRDREQLTLSLALLAPETSIHKSLLIEKDRLAQEIAEDPALISFTNLWEEELASRFSTTAYLPLPAGEALLDGRFKIVRQLNLGGWSAVYLAIEDDSKTRVIKESVMPVDAPEALKEKAQAMFDRETKLLLKIEHDNIVKVHDHFVDKGRHYIVLDFLTGENLRKMVQISGPQHELDVIHWALSMADMLDYLHNLHPPLVHRDFTPDNIILDNTGELRLIDFGAANEFIGTATGTMVGKQSYMAPEQFKGKANIQSDLYSLGATLYFLLTAKDPLPMGQSSVSRLS